MDKYLILVACILLNALIGVVFKLFPRYKIHTLRAITLNYFVCFATASVVMQGNPLPANILEKPWLTYALLMGLLFIGIFNLVAKTVAHFGVVVASIFQKMSLVAPALIAVLWYNESSGPLKWTGIVFCIVAIGLLSYQKEGQTSEGKRTQFIWLFPILTFAGSCLIDAALFLIEHHGLAASNDASFIASLFLTAGLAGLALLAFQAEGDGFRVKWVDVAGGIALGIPNFFSIHLLLVALSMGWEGSRLFPINNTGVLLMSVAIGIFIFREQLTLLKSVGIVTAILAIVLIAIS